VQKFYLGVISALVVISCLFCYGYRYEHQRANQYLDIIGRGESANKRLENQLSDQGEELKRAISEVSQLRRERNDLVSEIRGIGNQIADIAKLESEDYERLSRLEAIMERIINLIRGLQERYREPG
jgi:chromosome segregation ATPase